MHAMFEGVIARMSSDVLGGRESLLKTSTRRRSMARRQPAPLKLTLLRRVHTSARPPARKLWRVNVVNCYKRIDLMSKYPIFNATAVFGTGTCRAQLKDQKHSNLQRSFSTANALSLCLLSTRHAAHAVYTKSKCRSCADQLSFPDSSCPYPQDQAA